MKIRKEHKFKPGDIVIYYPAVKDHLNGRVHCIKWIGRSPHNKDPIYWLEGKQDSVSEDSLELKQK